MATPVVPPTTAPRSPGVQEVNSRVATAMPAVTRVIGAGRDGWVDALDFLLVIEKGYRPMTPVLSNGKKNSSSR